MKVDYFHSIAFTIFKPDISLTEIHVHFRMVFSSAWNVEWRLCSFVYSLRKFSPHKRCIGLKPIGATPTIRVHTIEATYGVTPKNDLKRLVLVDSFWPVLVFDILFPSCKNLLGRTAIKQLKRKLGYFNVFFQQNYECRWLSVFHVFITSFWRWLLLRSELECKRVFFHLHFISVLAQTIFKSIIGMNVLSKKRFFLTEHSKN